MPFVPYTNGIVSYDIISDASRGAFRPTWELLYAHYAQVKGVDAPWTEKYKNYTVTQMGGFEGGGGSWGEGSGHYDGLGWGSLLYHLDESDVAAMKSANPSSVSDVGGRSTTANVPQMSVSSSAVVASTTALLSDVGSTNPLFTATATVSTTKSTSPSLYSVVVSPTPDTSTSVVSSSHVPVVIVTEYVYTCG